MKKAIFLFATVALVSCATTSTTMQQKVVVTQVKQTKKGVRVYTARIGKATPLPGNHFKAGDTLTMLSLQK